MWYSVVKVVPMGEGNYGTDRESIFNCKSSKAIVDSVVRKAEAEGAQVEVYRGKDIGRQIYTTLNGVIK